MESDLGNRPSIPSITTIAAATECGQQSPSVWEVKRTGGSDNVWETTAWKKNGTLYTYIILR